MTRPPFRVLPPNQAFRREGPNLRLEYKLVAHGDEPINLTGAVVTADITLTNGTPLLLDEPMNILSAVDGTVFTIPATWQGFAIPDDTLLIEISFNLSRATSRTRVPTVGRSQIYVLDQIPPDPPQPGQEFAFSPAFSGAYDVEV